MKIQRLHKLSFPRACLLALAVILAGANFADEFKSDWNGDRVWVGPEFWANPLTDWKVKGAEVIAMAAGDRTLHHLTHQVVAPEGDLELDVRIRLEENGPLGTGAVGGFRIGNQAKLDDYRYRLIDSTEWIDAGIQADGRLLLGDSVSDERLNPADWIDLRLQVSLAGGTADLVLQARQSGTKDLVKLAARVPAGKILGNLALLAGGSGRPDRDNPSSWHFKNWKLKGSVLSDRPDQAFGPILWTQYTLSRGTLKLLAMMAPVGNLRPPVRLEFKENGQWNRQHSSLIDPLSSTVVFRMDNWDENLTVPYRVLYSWQGKAYVWEGVIRPDPVDKSVVTMAVFSCDNGYNFPNTRIVQNVAIQDPDILFFSGDQIYESFGGFGINRSPVELAMLDYLRKYWQFGWSWRELLKNRPSIIIPDDHDVFQGNLWGHGGRKIPQLSDKPSGSDWPKGGYAMDPEWINAIQRAQTGSLPDPVDPQPVEQGIKVYFTDMLYGGIHMAILEDRKFKTGPKDPFKEEPQLLGPRQEAFLESWVKSDDGDFKVALSQTIFCDVATHTGQNLKENSGAGGNDSNGWPSAKRDKALSILREKPVIMVHGDQHLGALVHQGVDEWEDAAIAFMVPGSANGFPRAWWPDHPGENHSPGEPEWSGRYVDSQGNKMTVLAAANPERDSNLLPKRDINPEILAHRKGSGHGIIQFNRGTGEATFEMWHLLFDARDPQPQDQFIGFPKTIKLSD